jgi:pimeloyl-ACP methyl ester carboxylesterase
MGRSLVWKAPIFLLAAAGVAALGVGGLVAVPLKRPPPMTSLHAGAMKIDRADMPDLSRFQARDGSWLAYRIYPATGPDTGRVVILAHGSSGSSSQMNGMAKAFAAAGVTAVAPDIRGHGASGTRGDTAYLGQVEDDLADLVALIRQTRPQARFALAGHSLGGGFVARIAGRPVGAEFDRLVMISPFLGHDAPTNAEGNSRWASADVPRLLGVLILRSLGFTSAEALPVIAYATSPQALNQTSIYSFRLLADYGPDMQWATTRATLAANAAKLRLVSGANDDLMNAPAYETTLKPLGISVTLVPNVDHMGACYDPAALAAVVAAVKGD